MKSSTSLPVLAANKMKILVLTVVLASFQFAPTVSAEVQPCIVVLLDSGSGFPSEYTIPAGKVFILEVVRNFGHSSGPTQAYISYGATHPVVLGSLGWTFDVNDTFIGDNPAYMQGKFRLVAGAKLRVPGNGAFQVTYMGLLIDVADLYAQVPVDLLNPRVNGGQLLADAQFGSPRPHIVKVKSSEDLVDSFAADASGEVTPTTDPSVDVVAVDADTDTKFIRVEAIARSN